MVYDCIPFFNELDILNLRLHVLDPYVDKFIIEEATVTFSGEPKELCFEKNKEMFREFLPKIEYIVVDNSPVNTTTHLRDKFQKNALEKGLADAGENDMILLSDVDEIPNPRVLQELKQNFDPDKVCLLYTSTFSFGLYYMQKKKIFVLCGNFFIFAGLNKKTDVLYSCTIVLCSNICELEQDTDKKRNSDCFFGCCSSTDIQ